MYWYYIIPIAYFLILIGIGLFLNKRQSKADFYVASNKMDISVLFATVMSTVVGANTYMGFAGLAYSTGFGNIWLLISCGCAYFVLYFISGKVRMVASKYEIYTLPDIVELRYSTPVAAITTLFSMVGLIGGVGGSILGLAIILNSLLGVPIIYSVVVTSVVMLLYTTFGGLWGTSIADWVQSLFMILGMVLCMIYGVIAISPSHTLFTGSTQIVSILSTHLKPGFINPYTGVTSGIVIAWFITFLPSNTISQTQITRVYAAKNVKTIQLVSLFMIIFVGMLMSFGLSFIGILGKQVLPNLAKPESVFPVLSMKIINPVVGMIVITGIMGACMSTVAGNLLAASLHISRDVYERYMKYKNISINEKHILNVSRISLIIICVLSTFAAVYAPSIMSLLLFCLKIFAGATFVPVIAGLFWERANANGALISEILGGGGVLLMNIHKIVNLDPVTFGIILSIIGLVVGSLITEDDKEKSHIFDFANIIKPKDFVPVIAVAIILVLWVFAIGNLALWPLIIIATIILLSLSIVLMVYGFIKARVGTKSSQISKDQKTKNMV